MRGDARIPNITVQHLLDHQGGWDSAVSPVGDPVFDTIQVSTELGLNYPAQPTNVISWMFAKPLDFTPGSQSAYANFGYQILGRVIEKASGKSFVNYVMQDVFGPFVPLFRSPEVMLRAMAMGDYLRYRTVFPTRLN